MRSIRGVEAEAEAPPNKEMEKEMDAKKKDKRIRYETEDCPCCGKELSSNEGVNLDGLGEALVIFCSDCGAYNVIN